MEMTSFIDQAVRILREHGLDVDVGSLDTSGKFIRCPLIGENGNKRPGSYKVFMDDVPTVLWWDFSGHIEPGQWRVDGNAIVLTDAQRAEIEQHRREREAEQLKIHEQNAKAAQGQYERASKDNVQEHGYATRKAVDFGPHVRRVKMGEKADYLLVPMYDQAGTIWSLQQIADGKRFKSDNGEYRDKNFLQGGRKKGCFCPVGDTFRNASKVLIGEGLATVAAGVQATGLPGVVAFDAGNLLAVSKVVRELAAPGADIIILGDDDQKPDTDKNPGIEAATKAAQAIGGRVALPGMGKKKDFWDVLNELGADAVKERIESGETDWNREGGQTASLAPWPEFVDFDELPPDLPEGILPGILGEFSEGLAHATQTPRELAAVNVLGVVALAVQHKLIVRVKCDYSEGLNIYAICASEPGERKSGIVSACKAPLVEWELDQELFIADEIREAVSKRKTMEKSIEKARNKAAAAKTAEERRAAADEIYQMECDLPEIPALPRLLIDDITPEALASVMAASGESIGMLEPEGGALDTFSGRYSNSVPNIDLLLKSFGAEPVIVDRKGKDPIRLRKPRLTMVLTPQPSVLRAAGNNQAFMGRGLIARCLLIMPQPRVGFRDNSQTMPESLTKKWTNYVNSLLAIQTPPAAMNELTLTAESYELWLEFSNEVEVAQRPGGEFEFMRAWASKLTGLVVRLAGLLHMAQGREAAHMQIDGETMHNAVRLAKWAAEHAKHVYSCFGLDDGQEAARRILEWLRKHRPEEVRGRKLHSALRGRFKTIAQLRPGLDALVDRGALVPRQKGSTSAKGGRPPEDFGVNPAIYETQG